MADGTVQVGARRAETILIVDDEEDILRLLEYNLTRAGFSCIKAADGPEAMELAGTAGAGP